MVYVFLADGFELIEALAPVDMLRRAKIGVMTVGIGGSVITASCGVSVTCDISDKAFSLQECRCHCAARRYARYEEFGKKARWCRTPLTRLQSATR